MKRLFIFVSACLMLLCCAFALAQTPQAQDNTDSLLWKISKNGETAGWLAGTLHAGKENRLPAGFQTALAANRALVLETEAVSDDYYEKHPAELVEMFTLIWSDKTLAQHLGQEKAAALHKLIAESPLTRGSAFMLQPESRVQPWFAALMTGYLGIPQEYSEDFGVDILLAREAKQSGKPLYGLERNEAMEMLAEIPVSTARAMIDVALAHQAEINRFTEQMLAAYECGDAAALLRLDKEMEDALMPFVPAAERVNVRRFEELLVAQRNRNWLPGINRHLNEGGRLIAVGAQHLYGKDGLVSLLRGDGWTVEAVKQ
ncbi:MAG: TraB/GumN family protein [Neisseria sp.]|nr:TraB/GumN family protein [Neisseria sp.]